MNGDCEAQRFKTSTQWINIQSPLPSPSSPAPILSHFPVQTPKMSFCSPQELLKPSGGRDWKELAVGKQLPVGSLDTKGHTQEPPRGLGTFSALEFFVALTQTNATAEVGCLGDFEGRGEELEGSQICSELDILVWGLGRWPST